MAVRVRVTAQITNLGPAVKRTVGPIVEKRANKAGAAMIASIDASMGKYRRRPPQRRRYPGSTHVNTGWAFKIVGDGSSLPLYINLTKSGDAVSQERVNYLNDGTPAHTIRRRDDAGWLRYPKNRAVNGPPWNFAKQVIHPGYAGDHFLEKAMQAGIDAAAHP